MLHWYAHSKAYHATPGDQRNTSQQPAAQACSLKYPSKMQCLSPPTHLELAQHRVTVALPQLGAGGLVAPQQQAREAGGSCHLGWYPSQAWHVVQQPKLPEGFQVGPRREGVGRIQGVLNEDEPGEACNGPSVWAKRAALR